MKSALKCVALAATFALASFSGAAAEQVRVGFAAEPFPPFAVPDASGEWTGWEVDITQAICAEAKFECIPTPLAWDGLIPALTFKKIDLIIGGMMATPERAKTIDFSDEYYKPYAGVIGLKGVEFEATPEGLADKIVGVQVSTIHQAYASKYFAEAGATVKEYPTQDEATNDLAAGRVDAVQADVVSLDNFLKTEQGKGCCELKGKVKDDPAILGVGAGVGIRKGDTDLKNKVNAAIKAIRANGTYDEISRKYFEVY